MKFSNIKIAFFGLIFLLADCAGTPNRTGESAWIRINHAGYTPDRVKIAVVLSDTDITGAAWSLKKDENTVISGTLSNGRRGDDHFSAQEYYFTIDFSAVKETGTYTLELENAQPKNIIISRDPYSLYATQALMHLRAVRSGGPTIFRNPSHLGDSQAIIYNVNGDWTKGSWRQAIPRRTTDMLGGHYDAGDQIKFTLCESSLAWHLLMAYEINPSLFVKVHSTSNLPDILDEAKHSLDYLAKTFPDENTFIIQVGDKNDHNQGWRLPERDSLNGRRPALSALSRVHMGGTAAALALGANIFKNIDAQAAALYESKAIAIYKRARQSDTQTSAFERDETNDFYYDPTDEDNMALAAAELYRLTRNRTYLDDAKAYAPPSISAVSWTEWNALANFRLAEHGDATARERLFQQIDNYAMYNVWDLPGESYYWGILPVWIGMGNTHALAQRLDRKQELTPAFLGVLDYTFGRNNWGLAMLASYDLPDSIRNIYSFIWHVQKRMPIGAMSAGPGDRSTHTSMSRYFQGSPNRSLSRFNTSSAVFYDNANDFMIQESTIWGQGNFILMMALASEKNLSPAANPGTLEKK